jgi:23S rRNA (guanine745-N1)-methyltransferase
MAKEGYVNLLLAHKRNSKMPGDNKEMVMARREFLGQGHYKPLVQTLAKQISEHSRLSSLSLFDAGCGEGYYLHTLISELKDIEVNARVSGVDISKPAVQKAAKLVEQGDFAVASTFDIPLNDASQDAVIQIFAPSSDSEIHRILKDQGIWLIASPAESHLFELKQMVYDAPEQHKADSSIPDGFTLTTTERVTFTMNLTTPETRQALLLMTPFYWQISEQKKDALLASLEQVTADFYLRVLRKSTV